MSAKGTPPRLMIVGPGELHDQELEVLGRQLVAHYGDDWMASHAELIDAVKRFVGASEDPYVVPGSGSLALEMGMVNLFRREESIVVPNTGYFGERLASIGRALGLHVIEIPVGIGEPVDPDAVAEAVASNKATGVAVCQVDTSVATRSDIAAIAAAAAAEGALTLVDGIASVGAERCAVDDMGLAALVTASQKGLESPPGLGVLALGTSGRDRVESRTDHIGTWYLDISNWDTFRREWPHHPHPVTMPVSLMLTMLSSLERLMERGLDTEIERKHALAARVRNGLSDLGLEPVARADAQAGMIVAAYTDRSAEIVNALLKEGIQIAGGLAPLAGKAIRIGVMGATANEQMIDRTLEAIGRVLG